MPYLDVRAWDEAGKRGEEVRARTRDARVVQRRLFLDRYVRAASQQIIDARADGLRVAVVGKFTEFETDVADLDGLDQLTTGSDVSSRLLGPWQAFRDELRVQGITLTAKARTEGHGCNGAHWVFDLVASW